MKQTLLLFAFLVSGYVALAQSASLPDLSVYPNPTTEFISVKDQQDAVGHLAVFNIMGRKVREFEYTKGERYSILDLPKGLYLVQIQDKNRKVITTQKVEKR
jgi:hypothetical protein